MLSICIPIKNRSKVKTEDKTLFLFPNCVKSLIESLTLTDNVELVISDWNSTDWPIKEWIENAFPYFPIQLINIQSEGFSAGLSRNIAADHSSGDNLLFLDADMLMNREVMLEGINSLKSEIPYYPTVKYQINNTGKEIIHQGGGNVFIPKGLYEKAGKWPEYYSHGFEDTDFANKIKEISKIYVTDNISIFHQWHPQTDLFKNAYASKDQKKLDEVDKRKEHYITQKQADEQKIATTIDRLLKNNSNTTHSNLNAPVRGDNRRLTI